MKQKLPQGEKPFPEIKRDLPKNAVEVKALVERVKESFELQQAEEEKEKNDRNRRSDYYSGYIL